MKTTRREFLGMLGFAVGTTALFGVCGKLPATKEKITRPPGVLDEDEFLSKCMRCKQCMYICATDPKAGNVLFPAKMSDGYNVVNTPVKIEENGHKCTACGLCKTVCPSGAIGGGEAIVPQFFADTCVGCYKCVGACPALALSEGENGYPKVDTALCTSCGTCVTTCAETGGAKDAEGNRIAAVELVALSTLVELPASNPNKKKATVDPEKCEMCAKRPCQKACVYDAITSADKKTPSVVDPEKCTGCGECAAACPFDAITLA